MMLPSTHFDRMFSSILTENFVCPGCQSHLRHRAVYHLARDVIARSHEKMTLLDVDDSWPGGEALEDICLRIKTTFDSSLPWGANVGSGAQNENLTCLTLPDQSVDVVISSEVHEHIEDTWTAFSEVHRVLKSGGTYIFTLPFSSSLQDSERLGHNTSRGILWNGYIHNHGDPRSNHGIPAFWLFGNDLFSNLSSIGFDVKMEYVIPPCGVTVPQRCFVAKRVD
jgi:SAM-dependent methyltransferase